MADTISISSVNDDELISLIQGKYDLHKQQADKYKAMLDAYHGLNGGIRKITPELIETPVVSIQDNNVVELPNGSLGTAEDSIVHILSDGEPRTVRDIYTIYTNMVGKDTGYKSFSSKVTGLGAKKNAKIKCYYIDYYPRNTRHWWGLVEWFDGDKLKNEYLLKMQAKTGIPVNEAKKSLFG